jgi:hypothetical protein
MDDCNTTTSTCVLTMNSTQQQLSSLGLSKVGSTGSTVLALDTQALIAVFQGVPAAQPTKDSSSSQLASLCCYSMSIVGHKLP